MGQPLQKLISRLHDSWDHRSPGERWSLIALGVALVSLIVVVPVYLVWVKPALNAWRLQRTLEQAAAFDAAQDYRNLLLSLQRAAQLSSHDIDTWQRIAGYLSEVGDDQAVAARQQVVALAPDDLAARIALASDALRFGEIKIGQDALAPVPAAVARDDAAFQRVASSLALNLGDVEAMKTHLAQLIALDPDDQQARLDLAVARTWSPDLLERAQGRTELEALLDQPEVRVRAALELLKDTAREQNGPRAGRLLPVLLEKLPPQPGNPVTLTAPREAFDVLAARLQGSVGSDADIAAVADWLASVRRASAALDWLKAFPPERRLAAPIAEIYTELLVGAGELGPALEPLRNAIFGPISTDTLLLALGARRLHDTSHPNAAREAWNEAVQQALRAPHNGELRVLARLAHLWRNPAWAETALTGVITRTPQAFWAYAALRDQWRAAGQTDQLWQLLDQWVRRQPDSIDVVTAWLRLGAALPRQRAELEAQAETRLAALPRSPRTIAARAGWQWLRGNRTEARTLLTEAGPGVAENPDSAFWAALVLQSSHPLADYPVLEQLDLLPAERRLLGLPASDR